MRETRNLLFAAIFALAIPAAAQQPGAADLSRVVAGSYKVDPAKPASAKVTVRFDITGAFERVG